MGMLILGLLCFLLSAVLIELETDDALHALGYVILAFTGSFFMVMGAMEDYKNNSIKKRNINPAIIECIIDIRNQEDETNITIEDAIAVYIECKRNGFSEEEIISFLLPDITKEEAKSIVKTYNLLEEEN